jgi:hypothetical protein
MTTMIINDWIKHEEVDRTGGAVLLFLYLLRAATADHLAALLDVDRRSVVQYIYLLNQREKKRMIRSYRLGSQGIHLYTLLPRGIEEVSDIMGKVNYYPISRAQAKHWKGLSDIFLRIINEIGLERFSTDFHWCSTYYTKQYLFEEWNRLKRWNSDQRKDEYKTMLAADALLRILGRAACWIEYDNNTERKNILRGKYHEYTERLAPIGNTDPVFWVCPNERRRDELKRWWLEWKEEPEQKGKVFPVMRFFSSGEETKMILNAYDRLLENHKKTAI